MALFYSRGSVDSSISPAELRAALQALSKQLGDRQKVLALPPDFTRFESRAGLITCLAHEIWGKALVDIMPALGTHFAMPDWQLKKMFPTVPKSLFRVHD